MRVKPEPCFLQEEDEHDLICWHSGSDGSVVSVKGSAYK